MYTDGWIITNLTWPYKYRDSLVAQLVKNLPAMLETWVWSLDWEDPLGRFLWSRERLPTPVFWPGEFHGLYSPWGCKESETTEQLSLPYKFNPNQNIKHYQNYKSPLKTFWLLLLASTSKKLLSWFHTR